MQLQGRNWLRRILILVIGYPPNGAEQGSACMAARAGLDDITIAANATDAVFQDAPATAAEVGDETVAEPTVNRHLAARLAYTATRMAPAGRRKPQRIAAARNRPSKPTPEVAKKVARKHVWLSSRASPSAARSHTSGPMAATEAWTAQIALAA